MILYQQHNSSVPYHYEAITYDRFEYISHLHRDPELICVLEGGIIATVEERTEHLIAGQFALILPNQVHSFTTPQNSRVMVIVFAEEYVKEFHKMLGHRVGKTSAFRMDESDREFFLKKTSVPIPHRMDICAALSVACGAYLKEKTEEGLTEGPDRRGDLLHQILSYISVHYTENISLTEMAADLGYEPHYLSRCFHRYFSKNFKQFINEYRLNHARSLLENGEMSIIDVAYASGFQSVRNFNRVYKVAEGCEPRRKKREQTCDS